MNIATEGRVRQTESSDEEIVRRVLEGDTALYEILMRRYNQRLYRVCRSVLGNDAEAEDVMQDAYVRAYTHLAQFEGRAKFATWLTRIAVHEALARSEKNRRFTPMADETEMENLSATQATAPADPEQVASKSEMREILEQAIERLPESYRTVFVLRLIEEVSTEETAEMLGLSQENVKIRTLRARAMLRKYLFEHAGLSASSAFTFHARRCDRVVKNVIERISRLP